MSSWEKNRRLDFVEDHLVDHGRINRTTLVAYFDISPGQAGEDIAAYAKANRDVIYDARLKSFRWKDGAKPKLPRHSSPARRLAWAAFQA